MDRYIFSADGKYLLGGMMVGDTADYVKLVALVKKKVCGHSQRNVWVLLGPTYSDSSKARFTETA